MRPIAHEDTMPLRIWSPRWWLLFALLFAVGCEETTEDLVVQGNMALFRRDAEKAVGLFGRVLDRKPNHVDAHRGMANAYEVLAKDEERAKWLKKGLAIPELGDSDTRFFRDHLEGHYLARAHTLRDAGGEGYAEALKAAVAIHERSRAAGLLGRHYLQAALRLQKEGKRDEAIDWASKVSGLKVSKALADEALTVELALRLEAFRAAFATTFAREHQAAVQKEGFYDPAAKRFKVAAAADVPPNVSPTDPDLTRRASDAAAALAYRRLLERLATLGAVAVPQPVPRLSFKTWKADAESWVRRPTTYRYAASVSYDEGVEAVFMMTARARAHGPDSTPKATPKVAPKPAAAPPTD